MLCGFLLCFSDHTLFLQAFLYAAFSDVSCSIFCQFSSDSFLFFTALCTSSDHHQVSRSFRFWSLVTSQTLFAASTILYFNVSQVTFWLFIFFCTSHLNFARFSPFSFQLLIHGFCFDLYHVWTLCILMSITNKRNKRIEQVIKNGKNKTQESLLWWFEERGTGLWLSCCSLPDTG